MAVTRIKNNQVTDSSAGNTQVGINAGTKLQDYSITAGKIANSLVYGSDLTVTGNLTVQGNSTAIDTTITTIEDPIIVLASTQTSGAPAVDIGYLGFRGNQSNIAFVWDESAGQFVTAFTSTGESNTTITITSYANLQIGNLSLTGNILNSTLNVTGNITGGNLLTPGLISATGTITSAANISGGNILTGGLISATSTITSDANITGGNILTGGLISATGNATAGNVLTAGIVSSTGNVTGGNVTTGGLITATGNVTGGNVLTVGLISATSTITSAANISGGNLLTGGLISATSTITSAANISGANILTGGLITATGNVTGGNVSTAGLITATGNVTGGNILTAGLISAGGNIIANPASFFIGNGSQLTGVAASSANFPVSNGTSNINAAVNANITVGVSGTSNVAVFAPTGVFVTGVNSVSGNVTGGNVFTAGVVSATGNITGGNILTAGLISATGTITSASDITGANVTTAGIITATGNITGGNVNTAGLITATGNITGGNVLTGGLISATGTITSATTITGGNVATAGTITATGNITGGNILTPGLISAAGLATSGNVQTAGFVSATGNVIGGNVVTPVLSSSAGLTIQTTASNGNITIQPNGTGNIILGGNTYVNGVSLLPVQNNDVASKYYVDILVTTAISYHEAVAAATNTTLATATGGTITYNQPNGAGNGIGATLTTTGAFNLIDTANVQTVGTRILVKDQANAVQNGVYVWSNATVITRSSDTDTYAPASPNALSINDYFFVSGGNVNAGSAWIVDSPSGTITFGTSNISFAQFSQAQIYSANTSAGLVLNGTVFSAKVDNNTTAFDGGGNIIVKAGANLTTPNIGAATGTSFSATGNVQGGNLLTGGFVTATGNLAGGNVTTGGLITATGNVTGGNLVTAGLITATGDITGGNVLTAGVVSATANVTGGNILTAGLVSATGTITSASNISGANIATAGLITATGNVTGGNVSTAGLITATGNVTGGNILTGGLISATGNIIANPASFFIGNGSQLTGVIATSAGFPVSNGTSNINAAVNANITVGVSGTSNVAVFAPTGVFVTGVNSVSGDVTGGNINTAGLVTATGNVTGGNLLTGGLISATANITGGNVLTAGLISATGNATLGNVGTNQLSLSGNVISALNVTSNITGGNLLTPGLISATGNAYVPAIVNNGTYNTQVALGASTGIIAIETNGNTTQFGPSGTINLSGASQILGGTFAGSGVTLGASQTDIFQNRGGNVTVQLGTGGTIANTWTFAQSGAFLAPGAISATGNITGANLILTTGTIDGPAAGRITINGSDIDTDFAVDGDTLANVFYVDAGTGTASFGASTQVTNAIVNFATTTSIKTPVGNTAQRPGTGVTGMLRFNTTTNAVEVFDNTQWTSVGVPVFTVIADEQFAGDGLTVAFTLGSTQTTNSCIVSINGVVQIPTLAYSVAGTNPTCVLTFTEAPAAGDVIDVRQITTTTSVTSISNSSGNAIIAVSATSAQTNVTGDLSVSGTILGGNINSTAITNGTSNVSVLTSGGNIAVNVGGSGIVTFTSAGIINRMGNGVGNIGNSTGYFNTIFAQSTSAQYADLAEKYTADAEYAPGTVVMFGGTAEVTLCVNDACSRVAGVVSTNPSYRMNDGLVSAHTAMVALTGRVPTQVTGTVRKGDMMVSAGNGVARAEANPQVGTVIGKALADSEGDAVIEVVVGRV